MKKCFILVLLFCLAAFANNLIAQPFADEIAAFKKADSFPRFQVKNPILFIGSSSFRKWETIKADFPGYRILNRGFGGSTLPDVTRYANEIIFPYKPKQIVIYCGENDLASSGDVTAATVFKRFTLLFNLVRSKLPTVPVAFVSIKPSPSRMTIQPEVKKANALIKKFLGLKKNSVFINVYDAMLNPDGTMRKELYVEDQLHMTAAGYAIWQRIIKPYLLR